MARPLRIQYSGAFYHVTSRGNERKDIFRSERDREKFLSYLRSAHERYGAMFHVYCLMDNHYHLLLETPRGNLSQIIQHLNGAYTTYFNIKRNRSGHLFQGRYQAILVEKEAYIQELSRYIHLNPIRGGLVENLSDYHWSSYLSYIGVEKKPSWLETGFLLGYFGERESAAQKKYRSFVEVVVGAELHNPLKDVFASVFLGGQDFIKRISRGLGLEKNGDSRNMPALKAIARKSSLVEIKNSVQTIVGEEDSCFKKICLYLSWEYGGFSLKEIGDFYGMQESAVSQAARRFKQKVVEGRRLRKLLREIVSRSDMLNIEI